MQHSMRFIHPPVALIMIGLILASCDKHSPQEPTSNKAAETDGNALAKGRGAHSVVGSGLVQEDELSFLTTVEVHQNAEGQVRGQVALVIDATAFGLGIIKLGAKATCLTVDGHSAWIGSELTRSTHPDIFPIGSTLITLVRDLGRKRKDITHTEGGDFFPPGTACSDKPALPETVVKSGNFHVR
jgi:hypothetical protein